MDPSDNPLGATDPTGYFSFKDALKIVAAVVVGVVTAGAALYAYGAVVGGSFIGGFVEGFGRDGFGRDRRIMLGDLEGTGGSCSGPKSGIWGIKKPPGGGREGAR
jgi:hypothetical protein